MLSYKLTAQINPYGNQSLGNDFGYYGTTPGVPLAMVKANGLVFGQYVSPVGEYIFPEPNVGGAVLTPYNFRCLAFLVKGWGQGGALTGIGQLIPFPEAVAPATVNCTF